MTKNNFIILALAFFLANFAYASMEVSVFHLNSDKIIKAKITTKSHTRITVRGDLIKEIIGDESLFQIINTSSRNHIFICPKKADLKNINISLITDKNRAIDLELELDDDASKVIIIEARK